MTYLRNGKEATQCGENMVTGERRRNEEKIKLERRWDRDRGRVACIIWGLAGHGMALDLVPSEPESC